jgi:uncharacterized protein (TIGR03086 family)
LDESLGLYTSSVEQVAERLAASTVCAGYSVLDLINHHLMTLDSFAAPIDGGPGASFEQILAARDVSGGDPAGATKRFVERVRTAYSGADPDESREYNVGPVPIGKAMAVLIMQNLVHAWDLSVVAGSTVEPSEDLLSLCEAVAAEFVPAVPFFGTPRKTSRTDRLSALIAFCGRDVDQT